MIKRILLIIFGFLTYTAGHATQHTVTADDQFHFVPDTLYVMVGDTVNFDLEPIHNVVEVSQQTWIDGGTTSNGGFQLGFGSGSVVITEEKTYYYVCQPHVTLGMKGIIIAEAASMADEIYVAQVSGSQVALPLLSTGEGQIRAELTGTELVVTGSFDNLLGNYTASHIHVGLAGQNGGVEIPLMPTLDGDNKGGDYEAANNTFNLTGDQLMMLRNRQLYVNIHSNLHPGGEIRGQLVPEADKIYYLNLFGSNAVPPIMSDGHGALVLEVHDDTLVVTGSFADLNGDFTLNHLHRGLAGENGGVEIPLNAEVDGDLKGGVYQASQNTFIIGDTERNLLERRAMYANIHSTRNPSGEIRGQAHEYATAVFRAFLAGSNEMPPILSSGIGGLLFELDGDDLVVSGSFSGFSSDFNTAISGGAHIHTGLAGRNGSIVAPLDASLSPGNRMGTFEASDNQFQFTDIQVQQLFLRGFYANLHSMNNSGGEIRGQILPESQFFLHGFLTGTQHVDPVLTDGAGALIAEITGQRLVVSGSFDNLNSEFNPAIQGGAHLHFASAGSNGPIAIPLSVEMDDDMLGGLLLSLNNSMQISTGMRDTLKRRMAYGNIHTQDNPGGELRAQMLHESMAYFYASLSGTSQPNPVRSTGLGAVAAEWSAGTIFASGSFSNLSSDFNPAIAGGAHLHIGMPGMNGGIRFPLTSTPSSMRAGMFPVENNVFSPGSDFADTLRNRMVYANIHTMENPGGEIRGNLLPYAVSYFTTSASGTNAVNPVASNGFGALKLELAGDKLTLSGAFNGLESDYHATVGSHLHMEGPGANGGVVIPLNPTISPDMRSGVYRPGDNIYTLTATQRSALRSGMLYLNIHSTDIPSGELRGQVLPETNAFPMASTITAPASGADVMIEGDPDMPFTAQWDTATDPDGNPVVYIWQLDTTDTFDTPLINLNRGTNTEFTTTIGAVSTLLKDLGFQEGQTIKAYHRVLSSDGAVSTPSATDSVSLALGLVSGFDEALARDFRLNLYPVPANDWLTLHVNAETAAGAQIQLIDMGGRMVKNEVFSLNSGENNHRIEVRQLPAGAYFLQMLIDGKPLRAKKFNLQR
jgi:plastocyanin